VKFWTAVAVALAALAVLWMSASGQSTSEIWVVSDGDVGAGTLRAAIEQANESSGDDLIRFRSAMTIRPRSPLPALEDNGITIDGSNGEASPDIRTRIWLDGSQAGDTAGLELIAARGVVRGLGVSGFGRYGIGVIGASASDALIEGNWVGLTSNGGQAANRLSGIAVIGGARGAQILENRIGGNSAAGRTGHGVVVGGGGSVDAVISGNVIGIAQDGTPAPNDDGILVVDSAQASIVGNTIGNSKVAGVELRETRLPIQIDGNRIGLRRDAGLASNDVGVFLGDGSVDAMIGRRNANVIAGNRVGIAVEQGARESVIENNWIGLAPADASLQLVASELPRALVRPNRQKGISIISGAAEILVRNNVVAAGDLGIIVADSNTTRVSLTRNVIAGSREGPTTAAIDIQAGTEISIGGEKGYGNEICGAEFGIRLANTEEASISANAIGAGVANRVTFDSDDQMRWGIRLDDGSIRTRVRNNQIVDASLAAISVVGASAQDNSLDGNQFARNGIDIDLGADGRTINDPGDRDRGPNQLLNHPSIVDHEVARISDTQLRSTITGRATPGSFVQIYVSEGSTERRIARSGRTRGDGTWTATTVEVPSGQLRALATLSAGATSEFSPSFQPSQRLRLRPGTHWFAWSGPPMAIEQAMSPVLRWVRTVWVWKSPDVGWRGWSPHLSTDSTGRRGTLERLDPGDVVVMRLSGRPPPDWFLPAGGETASEPAIVVKQGFNSVTWPGGRVDALDALAEIDRVQPGVIGSAWQWDGSSWQLIWPRLRGAWDPGQWNLPVLWIRATRDAELQNP